MKKIGKLICFGYNTIIFKNRVAIIKDKTYYWDYGLFRIKLDKHEIRYLKKSVHNHIHINCQNHNLPLSVSWLSKNKQEYISEINKNGECGYYSIMKIIHKETLNMISSQEEDYRKRRM